VWNRVAFDGSKLSTWNGVSDLLGPILEKDVPEVERAVRVVGDKKSLFLVGCELSVDKGRVSESGQEFEGGVDAEPV
jgi:putative ABC transport system permease protein